MCEDQAGGAKVRLIHEQVERILGSPVAPSSVLALVVFLLL